MKLTRRSFGKVVAGVLAGLGLHKAKADELVITGGSSTPSITCSESHADYDYWPDELHAGMILADPYGKVAGEPCCWLLLQCHTHLYGHPQSLWVIAQMRRFTGGGMLGMKVDLRSSEKLQELPVISDLDWYVEATMERGAENAYQHFQATYGPLVKGE